MAIVTAYIVHAFSIADISLPDSLVVLFLSHSVELQHYILVCFAEGKVVNGDVIWTGKIMEDSFCVSNTGMTNAWQEPRDQR